LDKKIVERAVPVSRNKLLSLGKERFAQLLDADHKARIKGTMKRLLSFAQREFPGRQILSARENVSSTNTA
jgi:hypothetical protein